ncbi:hypothetical protein GH714_032274 [Hevea brasiliensis]|uniref:Uncharacterized protein n=1 Tax=Hevea brasiliensis TaxID=3981 RepID=A0A6A6LDK0_HEVBR|nr:hypothetical protein GH714_032274 [Hevea brasiliensis]
MQDWVQNDATVSSQGAVSTRPCTTASPSSAKTLVPDDDFSLAKCGQSHSFILRNEIRSHFVLLGWVSGFHFFLVAVMMVFYCGDASAFSDGSSVVMVVVVSEISIRDELQLDEALKRIFQYGQGGGIPRRSAPILQMIHEEVTEDGNTASPGV